MNIEETSIAVRTMLLISVFLFLICAPFARAHGAREEATEVVPEPEAPRNGVSAFPGGTWRQGTEPPPERSPAPAPVPGRETPKARSLTVLPKPPESADWLVRRMAVSPDPEARSRALEAWPVSDAFMEDMNGMVLALADAEPRVRDAAQNRLSSLDAATVFGYVMRTLTAGSPERARALDAALPALGPVVGSLMLETLRAELEIVPHKRVAAYCLGRMRHHAAWEELARLASHSDPDLARTAVDALYAIQATEAFPHWQALLGHSDPHFRAQALRAIAALRVPASFGVLRSLALNNADPGMQAEAMRLLDKYPTEAVVPLLVEVMEQHAPLRLPAARLLRARTGMDFPAQPGPWRAWLNAVQAGPPPPVLTPGQGS